jgi:hypothetical protein
MGRGEIIFAKADLQQGHDLSLTESKLGAAIARDVRPRAA